MPRKRSRSSSASSGAPQRAGGSRSPSGGSSSSSKSRSRATAALLQWVKAARKSSSGKDNHEDADLKENGKVTKETEKAKTEKNAAKNEEPIDKKASDKKVKKETKTKQKDVESKSKQKEQTKNGDDRSKERSRQKADSNAASEKSSAAKAPTSDVSKPETKRISNFEDPAAAIAPVSPEEVEEKTLEKEIENLKEMLSDKEREKAAAADQDAKREVEKEIEVVTNWLRGKEKEAVERDLIQLREKKRAEEQQLVEEQVRSGENKKLQELERLKNAGPVFVPELGLKVPPCELPLWCVIPNRNDIVDDVEILRRTTASAGPHGRLCFGRRSWVLLGRRLDAQASQVGPEPDIGLASPRASRAHAVILRNWVGKIFLMDLGSSHGTFFGTKNIGVKRLQPHQIVEWKAGVTVYFADTQAEVFELHPATR